MRPEFHCFLHLNILKREEGTRAELQNSFGVLYRESIMTLEANGSLSTVRCYCLLTGNTGVSLLLCGAANEDPSGGRSCSGSGRGELVLASGPRLIYPRTVSDMSAGAGNKWVKANAQARKTRSWDHAGGGGVAARRWGRFPKRAATSQHLLKIHSDLWWRSEQRCAGAACRGFYSSSELGWRQQHRHLQGLSVGDLFFPTG